MEEKVLNLQVSCEVKYTLQPVDDQLDLQSFLSDFHHNLEIVDLLEEGESVRTSEYELTPSDDNLIGIARLGPVSQTPFYLSNNTLRSISQTLSHYGLEERFVEVGIEYETVSDTSANSNSQTNETFIAPECNTNDEIQALEDNLITFGDGAVGVDNHSTDSEVEIKSDRQTVATTGTNGSLSDGSTNILDWEDYSDSSAYVERDDHIIGSDEDFLDSTRQPEDDLPPKELNVVANLLDLLRNEGSNPEYYPETHKNLTNETFSNTVSFKIGSEFRSYESCTRFARKKDAKNNVAYQACKALQNISSSNSCSDDNDLPPKSLNYISLLNQYLQMKRTLGSPKYDCNELPGPLFTATLTFQGMIQPFRTSKGFPNKADAKKSVAYKACRRFGLC